MMTEFEIGKLDLKDGDILVFRFSADQDFDDVLDMADHIKKLFQRIDKKIEGLFFWGEVEIDVIRIEDV